MPETTRDPAQNRPDGETNSGGLTTAAVLVTYNRLELLKRSLDSVVNQTLHPDRIFVVDNHSTDGTTEWLKDYTKDRPNVDLLMLPENTGASGGFSRGIRAAYEFGADWIWTLDDDTITAPDALEQLVARIKPLSRTMLRNVGFLCSKVIWKDGSRHVQNVPLPNPYWWDGYDTVPGSIKLDATSFVSALFNRMAVQDVGYPVQEFFIWWDDVEYTLRMAREGYWGYHVDESQVVHMTTENRIASYGSVNHGNAWKYQYGIRNEIALLKTKKYGRIRAGWRMVSMVLETWRHGIPIRLILALVLWGFKGYFFDYRKLITKPETP
jgi:rhamnopyranosyl-N-acetylglucosaminyl-diphospho-decaprenol beta-1,3/1,4-galactofuranosyltransferase